MNVKGLIWLGTKTERFPDMVRFYEEVLGLSPDIKETDFAVYRLPGGETLEVFGPTAGHDSLCDRAGGRLLGRRCSKHTCRNGGEGDRLHWPNGYRWGIFLGSLSSTGRQCI